MTHRAVTQVITLALFGSVLSYGDTNGQELLNKIRDRYSTLQMIHVVADHQEVVSRGPSRRISDAVLELAVKPGHRYYARFQQQQSDGIAVSDGENTWKALASKKQWLRIAAASLEEDAHTAANAPRDLYRLLAGSLLGHYRGLAGMDGDANIVKDQECRVGNAKIPCTVLQVRTPDGTLHELRIDKERFLVLEERENLVSNGKLIESTLKVKQIAITGVDDAWFQFEPKPNWTEVEALSLPGEDRLPRAGDQAVNFSLTTLGGEAFSLDGQRGQVVVLDFWATWCPPCRAEMPSLEKLRNEFGPDVRFYGIDNEDASTIRSFQKSHKYEMPVLLDSKREVEHRYGVNAIPTLLIVDRSGTIAHQFQGSRSETQLRKAIASTLEARSQ
jgi:thiol-disulfide isomerase/thioredoxin